MTTTTTISMSAALDAARANSLVYRQGTGWILSYYDRGHA